MDKEKCEMCGVCCKIFLINLSEQEYNSQKFATVNAEHDYFTNFEEVQKYGLNILDRKEDGSCIYLQNKLCSIHNDRPIACQNFFCKSDEPEFKKMREEVIFAKT